MASDKVSLCDIVRALYGRIAEAEVRNRKAACLLRVVLEVCLNVFIGVVADDLYRVLVCADSTVAAETPEFASNCACGSGVRSGLLFEGKTCNVIGDTDCEAVLRSVLCEVFINRKDRCGRRIL